MILPRLLSLGPRGTNWPKKPLVVRRPRGNHQPDPRSAWQGRPLPPPWAPWHPRAARSLYESAVWPRNQRSKNMPREMWNRPRNSPSGPRSDHEASKPTPDREASRRWTACWRELPPRRRQLPRRRRQLPPRRLWWPGAPGQPRTKNRIWSSRKRHAKRRRLRAVAVVPPSTNRALPSQPRPSPRRRPLRSLRCPSGRTNWRPLAAGPKRLPPTAIFSSSSRGTRPRRFGGAGWRAPRLPPPRRSTARASRPHLRGSRPSQVALPDERQRDRSLNPGWLCLQRAAPSPASMAPKTVLGNAETV
jgi:hypothetical protein